MSDYINFDDEDDNTPNPSEISTSSTSGPEPFENMNVDGRTAAYGGGMVDTDFAGMSQLPQFVDPMSLQLNVGQAAFAGSNTSNAFQAPIVTPATSSAAFGAMDLGSGDVDIVDPFGTPVDISATYCDSLTMSPDSQGWNMTDNFQTPIDAVGILDDFDVADPMTFTGDVDLIPTAQEIGQLPSMWVPVSPGHQQQLNSEFAPQLGLLAADPSPPPVLFLPAEGVSVHPVSNIPSFLPNTDLPWNGFPNSPQLDAEPSTADPTSIVQGTGEVSSLLLPPAGTYGQISSDADAHVPNAEDQALISTNMRAIATDGFQLEPAPKRTKIAEPLPATLKDMGSNDDNDGVVIGAETAGHVSLPTDVKDEDYDDTVDAEGETDPDYVSDNNHSSDTVSAHASSNLPANPTPQKGPNWRSEQAEKIRLRKERREERDIRQADGASVKGKARGRKTGKLLKEIEDSKGFTGVQGVEVGESGRPVRRGARKNYKGQE